MRSLNFKVLAPVLWGLIYVLILFAIYYNEDGMGLSRAIFYVFSLPVLILGFSIGYFASKHNISDWVVAYITISLVATLMYTFDEFFDLQVIWLCFLAVVLIYRICKKFSYKFYLIVFIGFLIGFATLRWMNYEEHNWMEDLYFKDGVKYFYEYEERKLIEEFYEKDKN